MLKNKTALITGGARGIGRGIALKMAENGANIALVYRGSQEQANKTQLELTDLGVKAEIYQCDVADFDATKKLVQDVIKDFGTFEILVNNAGITRDKLLIAMKEDDFDAVINTNLKGAFNMTKHAGSHLLKKRCGRIVNISSISGMMGNIGQCNYSAAKAGLIGLTKSSAKEMALRGVTCNAIAPGFIKTDMTDALKPEIIEKILKNIPLNRFGSIEDIANMCVYLSSDLAGYITGEVIKIDGGLYI
ncbi:MAG: 3-oxoacyl-[acyl-carrier protein] reductase [Eubacteriaceae bacterium]|jgi:3-oxoacyl-[acyl-carrier protein] reductase|nr:3-oxoacyl-[acyl-carrier protein] reductase [Eubacteriaceae bacterium]MDK2905621.1 3-oxoacyl-[acyl-carrier protein] reductase [Eubacteriaceae bacterium]MDK2961295.1 3-oxoacyl-[acyl-carrier protein] reductase [Eubacteriaceae bacterium]MDN5307429.1 3-oxoacyl-[acyl-carrier protein] reductase [Eubacteriaceae bacterium]